MRPSETITRTEAIEQIVAQMDAPLGLDEFVSRVLAIWPSKAKNPQAGVRQAIRDEYVGKSLLFLDESTLIPMRLAMPGIRFRVPLTRQEINRGWMFVFPAFQFMAKRDIPAEDFRLEDVKGQTIPVKPVSVKTKMKTIFGLEEHKQNAFDLGEWYKKHNLRRGNSVLVTILDWESGRFRLQPETTRERQRYEVEIQQQNQALADHLFLELETARAEYVWGQRAIPTAYLRLKDPDAYPADHWYEILENDPRMKWMGYEIRYVDWTSPLEGMFGDLFAAPTSPSSPSAKSLSKGQTSRVYRFKAALWHRKGLWRRIEIQGGQTLADFDDILRDAFEHDHFDHLSGFWKLVRRGKSRRFREVGLGNINPFGEGEAAEIQVASLELAPGEALKYVYDFGDWIEHRIELEAVVDSEEDAAYPRVVGQNK
ncbi:MAG: hypothetical protein AB1649_33640, partial [Chloroflexota bacterium]